MKILNNRNEIINLIPEGAIIVEIGVFKGEYSKVIHTSVNFKHMYLVDVFEGNTGSGDKDGENMCYVQLEDVYKSLTEFYNEKNVTLIKGYSHNVIPTFQDNFIDFIYIDADHTYESVKRELNSVYSKVKIGGIISGHDYCSVKFPGVVRAVIEFCTEKNLQVTYITQDKLPSFVIYKK